MNDNDEFDHLRYIQQKRTTWAGIAQHAADGDHECIRNIARMAEVAIWDDPKIDIAIKHFLCNAFMRIAEGEDPNRAFGYTRAQPGRPYDYWKDVRDRDVACAVEYLLQQEPDIKKDAAYFQVATTYIGPLAGGKMLTADAVKKAHYRFFSSKKGKK